MRWPGWLRWLRPRPDGHDAAAAHREAVAKLHEARALRPEAQAALDEFTAAVDAALARRRR
jgi:hypothetical protein